MQGIKTVALKHLATALENDANHIPSIVLLCQILFDDKKYDQIQKTIDKVSVLLREHDEILFIKAKLLYLTDHVDESISILEKVLSYKNKDIKFYDLALKVHKKNNDILAQQQILESIIDIEPTNGNAHLNLGKLINDPLDFEKKKLILEIAFDLLPSDSRPSWELAKIYINFDDSSSNKALKKSQYFEKALKYLQTALKIKPTESKYIFALSKLYFEHNKPDLAEKNFRKLISSDFKEESFFFLGLLNNYKGNIKDAETNFTKAFGSLQYKSQSMFEFCKLKISQKEFKIVESYLEELINSLRNDEVKNYTISKSLSEKNEFYMARKILKRGQHFKRLRSEALVLKYITLSALSSHNDINLLHKSIEIHGQNHKAYFELGLIEKKIGNLVKAKDYFEKACNLNWGYIESHYHLSKVEIDMGNIENAKFHIEVVCKMNESFKDSKRILKKLRILR